MDIYIGNAADKIYLNGASVVAPVKSCQYVPAAGVGETVLDVLDISMNAGSTTDIFAALTLLERKVTAAKLWASKRYGQPVYLGVQVSVAPGYYVSEILDGWLEEIGGPAAGPAQREKGSQLVRLHLRRQNYFEGALVQLYMTNQHVADTLVGAVYNHGDAAHDNFVTIDDALLLGGQPARCEIQFYHDINDARSVRNVFMGLNAMAGPGSLATVLEAEEGTGGADSNDAACSGGKYRALAFGGTGEALLEYWNISSVDLAYLRGNLVRPVARQQAAHVYADLYFKWKVMAPATTTVIWESDWQLSAVSESLQELPVFRLPPYALDYGGSPAILKLCLYARRDTAGNHTFNLDFVQLFVTDGFRKWEGIYPAPYLWPIRDDGFSGMLQTTVVGGNGDMVTHTGIGSQILLYPGVDNKLTFLWDQDDLTAPIARSGRVVVYYAPRVRCF